MPVNEWKVDKRDYMWSDEEGFDEEDEDELQLPLDKAVYDISWSKVNVEGYVHLTNCAMCKHILLN